MRDDYADMVNPYVRAELEAEQRGRRQGWGEGVFITILIVLALIAVFYNVETRAQDLRKATRKYQPTEDTIKASAIDARITVCHKNAGATRWTCWSVR